MWSLFAVIYCSLIITSRRVFTLPKCFRENITIVISSSESKPERRSGKKYSVRRNAVPVKNIV